ncbi:hypothetical protein BGX21_004097 [Mortierella sp. AD011]|nr:hypothetical protein BGX20_000286 [Mortierella sp. AD010]KAF9374579.1 hypothetical protein BGX21_004097 [Mortierella sp. AD011]
MTEEGQQKIRSLVEMTLSYVVEPKPLSVPVVPETLEALVGQLNSKLSLQQQGEGQQQVVQKEDGQGDEESWDGEAFGVRLAGLGKLLSNDVTKATLACKPPAETKTVIGMVDALGETCFRLAGFIDSIPVKVAGQTYKREIQTLANDIFLATAGLLNEFLDVKVEKLTQIQQQSLVINGPLSGLSNNAGGSSGSSKEAAGKEDGYLVKAGIVWEACEIFEKASRSNHQAVAKKWGDMMSTLEDAIAEVQEMINSNDDKKDSNDESDDDEDGGSGSDSDDSWNDDEKMTEEEKQLSIRANALLKLTKLLFKKLQQRCLDVQPSLTITTTSTTETTSTSSLPPITLKPSDLSRMWDQLYDRARGIVALADEVATSLYSPQDQAAIIELMQELSRKNHDCILVGRLFVRGQAEHEKWLDMCEAQSKKILDTVQQHQ